MTTPVIDIRNAVVAYNGAAALDNVSMQVAPGECVIISGANGAGKTTLLTAINGLTRLNGGDVYVFGERPVGRDALRLRGRIGYVAQSEPLDPRMPITLRESVMTGLYGRLGWRRKPGVQENKRIDELLDALRILPLANRPLGQLSGGETRRVMIARALAQTPDIMLLDEPTASLDDASRCTILELMARLHRERGMTILWVTHDLEALPDTALRLVRIRNGRLLCDSSSHRDVSKTPPPDFYGPDLEAAPCACRGYDG